MRIAGYEHTLLHTHTLYTFWLHEHFAMLGHSIKHKLKWKYQSICCCCRGTFPCLKCALLWLSHNKFNKFAAAGAKCCAFYLCVANVHCEWYVCNSSSGGGAAYIDRAHRLLFIGANAFGALRWSGPHWISNETLCSPFKKCHPTARHNSHTHTLSGALEPHQMMCADSVRRTRDGNGRGIINACRRWCRQNGAVSVFSSQRTKKLTLSGKCMWALFGPRWILDG